MTIADNSVGVVIPTLNERDAIAGTIESLLGHDIVEIVVADGGSTDGTLDILTAYGHVRIVHSARGRGRQITAGVKRLRSPVVVLLHADTQLPAAAVPQIRKALADPAIAGGCFRLTFDDAGRWLGFYAWMSRFDSYWTTFGDQAFFFRRRDFDHIGGAPEWPLFEDVELRRRFRMLGRFRKMPSSVRTSARRFRARGPIRTQIANGLLLSAYALGISPERLAAFYRR